MVKREYNYVKNFLLNYNYFLLDEKYINSKTKLTFVDSEGYCYYSSFNEFYQNRSSRKFSKFNPFSIKNISLWIKLNKKKFILLSDVYTGRHEKLKWKCLKKDCGEIFFMTWNDILGNHGCSYCKGSQVGFSNSLATRNPELSLEFHITLNGELTPNKITSNSKRNIWWKCKHCGHTWRAKVCDRNGKKSGCPQCNKSKGEKKCKEILSSFNLIGVTQEEYEKISSHDKYNISYFIYQKSFNNLLGVGNGLLSYDFYIPNNNLLIEYQGQFHDGSSGEYSMKNFKKQQEHDKRKKEYAEQNGYELLEIWYYDFNKIEEILNNILVNNDNCKIINVLS